MFMPGQCFCHYTIEEELGKGSMGFVFKARTPEGAVVALKIVDKSMDFDHTFAERFQREADICSALAHPNIVGFHEAGEADDLSYIAFEYVQGETLEDRLAREGPLPVDDAVRIGASVADALSCAYRCHVIHRDIKPANVLLSNDGRILVMDFGIAREEGAAAFTMPGCAMGTPAYMSPEEATGEVVDHRHDVYSIGILMYEMLMGRPPFTGRNPMEILHKHVSEAPQPIRRQRPDVPKWLESVIMKAMEKDRCGRYQTAEELLEKLRNGESAHAGACDAASAPPPERKKGLGGWLSSKMKEPTFVIAVVAAIAVYVIFMLVVAAAFLYYAHQGKKSPRRTRLSPVSASVRAAPARAGVEQLIAPRRG